MCRWPTWRSRVPATGSHLPSAGAAADGDHLTRVVGNPGARPPLRAVHDQHRAREAVAHAVGAPALLPRPRLDARAGGGCGVPPPLHHRAIFGDQGAQDGSGRAELTLKYLTPHSKWSIISSTRRNLHMLTLFRGGGMLWVSREDAEALEIKDNDWSRRTPATASSPAAQRSRTGSRRGRSPGRRRASRRSVS